MPGVEQAHQAVTWGALALAVLSVAIVLVGALLGRLLRAHADASAQANAALRETMTAQHANIKETIGAVVQDNTRSNAEVRLAVEKIGSGLDGIKAEMSAHATRIAIGDQWAQETAGKIREISGRVSVLEGEARGKRRRG